MGLIVVGRVACTRDRSLRREHATISEDISQIVSIASPVALLLTNVSASLWRLNALFSCEVETIIIISREINNEVVG